jgi:hypothetical protein
LRKGIRRRAIYTIIQIALLNTEEITSIEGLLLENEDPGQAQLSLSSQQSKVEYEYDSILAIRIV